MAYRTSPPISPGLICVPKAFLMGLTQEGGLSKGEGRIRGFKTFSEKKSRILISLG